MKGLPEVDDLCDQTPANHNIDRFEVHVNNISLSQL